LAFLVSQCWKLLAKERERSNLRELRRRTRLKLDFSVDAGDSPLKSPRLSPMALSVCIRAVHVSFCLINLKRAYFFFGCTTHGPTSLSLLCTTLLYSQITRKKRCLFIDLFFFFLGEVLSFALFSNFLHVQLGNIPRKTADGARNIPSIEYTSSSRKCLRNKEEPFQSH
jgi:hypothetical protein